MLVTPVRGEGLHVDIVLHISLYSVVIFLL